MPDFRPVTPHIWRLNLDWNLRIPFYPPIPVAVWLIKEGDEWTLVDAGTPEQAAVVMGAVARFLGSAQPSRLILTHAHYDHGGALAEANKRWSCPIWTHTAEADFVIGLRRYRDIETTSWVYRLAGPAMREVAWRLPVARLLNDGDTAGSLEVIHVPGHAPGMIALHHKTDRAIIAGDTFMNLGHKLSAPLIFSTPDPAEARRSMHKLAARDFDLLLPSHDPSERGIPAEAVRRFVSRL